MKTITQTYLINAPIQKVWEALVDPKIIEKWGAGPAKMSTIEGEEFSLWDGDIHGKNIKVTPPHKLVQEWFGGNWDKPSIVTFQLVEIEGKTQIDLVHNDVPDNEEASISDGWNKYYLEQLKILFD